MSATRSTPATEAWRSLLIAFTGVYHELAFEMEEKVGLPIEHYEILLMLYQADGMRPSDIAKKRRLTRSGATRLVDRLERGGLIARRSSGSDRRVSLVELTAEGQRVFTRAGRIHLDGIERLLGQNLTTAEMAELQSLLDNLASVENNARRE